MMRASKSTKVKYTTSLPTAIIFNGLDTFGYELAKSLTDRGGYVIIIDNIDKSYHEKDFHSIKNIAILDFLAMPQLSAEIRRLDYVFYLNHNTVDGDKQVSSSEFLAASSYLNQLLELSLEFESLFLLTSSITLHQSVNSKDLWNDKDTFKTYSQKDILRYAENLVSEYKQNKRLQAKIIRLGEILGEGIELVRDTNISRLVTQAVKREDLILEEDGLASEYYVHLLDAVHAVIKTQFSRDLEEYVYTVSYHEPITQLSLAYKIQELEPDAGEIKFVDNTSGRSASVNVYKPAPNLSITGWYPKIDLETALIQSIMYTKKLLGLNKPIALNSVDRIPETADKTIANNALARLIAERKQNDLNLSDKYIANSERTVRQGISSNLNAVLHRRINKITQRLAKNLGILQTLTLQDLFLYIVLMAMFTGIFFVFLAPMISAAKDLTLFDRNFKSALSSVQTHEWVKAADFANQARQNATALNNTVKSTDTAFALLNAKQQQLELLGLVQSLIFFSDGLENHIKLSNSAENYYDSKAVDLVLRPTNASVLSIDRSNTPNSQTSATNLLIDNQTAINTLNTAARIQSQLRTSLLPKFLNTYISDLFSNLPGYLSAAEQNTGLYTALNVISRPRYRLGVLIQDNLRQNYGGGEVSGVGYLEFSNGAIVETSLLPIQNLQLATVTYNPAELSEIKQLYNGSGDAEKLTVLEGLRYIFSRDVFLNLSRRTLAATFSKDIDSVVTIDLSAVAYLLNTYGPIQINKQELTSSNYVTALTILQNDSFEARNSVITNSVAVLISKLLSKNNDLFKLSQNITDLHSIGALSVGEEIYKLLEYTQARNDLEIAVKQNTTSLTTTNTSPSIDLNLDVDYTGVQSKQSLDLNLTNAVNSTNALVCVTQSTLDPGLLATELYTKVNLGRYSCVLLDSQRVKQFKLSYVSKTSSKLLEQRVHVSPGLLLRYDIQTTYPGNMQPTSAIPEPATQANSLFYSGEVYNQFSYKINF